MSGTGSGGSLRRRPAVRAASLAAHRGLVGPAPLAAAAPSSSEPPRPETPGRPDSPPLGGVLPPLNDAPSAPKLPAGKKLRRKGRLPPQPGPPPTRPLPPIPVARSPASPSAAVSQVHPPVQNNEHARVNTYRQPYVEEVQDEQVSPTPRGRKQDTEQDRSPDDQMEYLKQKLNSAQRSWSAVRRMKGEDTNTRVNNATPGPSNNAPVSPIPQLRAHMRKLRGQASLPVLSSAPGRQVPSGQTTYTRRPAAATGASMYHDFGFSSNERIQNMTPSLSPSPSPSPRTPLSSSQQRYQDPFPTYRDPMEAQRATFDQSKGKGKGKGKEKIEGKGKQKAVMMDEDKDDDSNGGLYAVSTGPPMSSHGSNGSGFIESSRHVMIDRPVTPSTYSNVDTTSHVRPSVSREGLHAIYGGSTGHEEPYTTYGPSTPRAGPPAPFYNVNTNPYTHQEYASSMTTMATRPADLQLPAWTNLLTAGSRNASFVDGEGEQEQAWSVVGASTPSAADRRRLAAAEVAVAAAEVAAAAAAEAHRAAGPMGPATIFVNNPTVYITTPAQRGNVQQQQQQQHPTTTAATAATATTTAPTAATTTTFPHYRLGTSMSMPIASGSGPDFRSGAGAGTRAYASRASASRPNNNNNNNNNININNNGMNRTGPWLVGAQSLADLHAEDEAHHAALLARQEQIRERAEKKKADKLRKERDAREEKEAREREKAVADAAAAAAAARVNANTNANTGNGTGRTLRHAFSRLTLRGARSRSRLNEAPEAEKKEEEEEEEEDDDDDDDDDDDGEKLGVWEFLREGQEKKKPEEKPKEEKPEEQKPEEQKPEEQKPEEQKPEEEERESSEVQVEVEELVELQEQGGYRRKSCPQLPPLDFEEDDYYDYYY